MNASAPPVRPHSAPARLAIALLVLALAAGHVGLAGAQTITGTLVGRIIDERGRRLEAVLVRLENLRSGFFYATRTNADGMYRIDLLPPSQYRITAEKEGFQVGVIERYQAEVNSTKEIIPPPITLARLVAPPLPSPGEARLQADTSDATRRAHADAELVTSLPLGGIRSFDALALLAPGVAPAPRTASSNGPGVGPGVGTAGEFSVNGQRARANNYTVDGSDNNDQDVGVRRQGFTPTIPVSVESISEFQLSTLLADAESGRNPGAQVNVVSQAGGNAAYGQAYAFLSDSRLNARDFFDLSGPLADGSPNPARNPFTRLQAGAVASGPLVRDRLHAFGSFERQVVNRLAESSFAVPTSADRIGALRSASPVPSLAAVDILLSHVIPYPNDPAGPYGERTLTRLLDASGDGALVELKVDGQQRLFGRSATFSARYSFAGDKTTVPVVDGAVNSSVGARTRAQGVALSFEVAPTERVAAQARVSYGRTSLAFDELPGSPFVFDSPRHTLGPVGRLVVDPYSPVGVDPSTFPQGRVNNTYQLAATVVVTSARHALKFGADVRRIQLNSFLDRNYRAQTTFGGGYRFRVLDEPRVADGLPFAAYGYPSNIVQALAVTPDSSLALRFVEASVFAHDSWRVARRLSVGLGVRYEVNTVPTDATGRLERELTTRESDLAGLDPSEPSDREFLRAFRAQTALYGGRTRIYEPDRNNVAGRAGFAWDVTGTGRVAVRGGYGLYYDTILGTVVSQSRNVFPSFIPVNFGLDVAFPDLLTRNPALLPVPLIVRGTTNTLAVPVASLPEILGQYIFVGGAGLAFTLPERNLRTPYTHQYGLTVEAVLANRYVVSLAYVGSSAHKLLRLRTPNGGALTSFRIVFPRGGGDQYYLAPNFTQDLRPDPAIGPYTVFEGSANSSYSALQASVTRRYDAGFDLRVSYTYAHAIDDVSDVFDTSGASALAQDELGRDGGLRAERGDAAFDVRHRLAAAWRYDVPWTGVALSGILTLQSGQPYTVLSGYDTNGDGNDTDRLETTAGLTLLDGGRTRVVRDPSVSIESLLPPSGLSGSVGRNTFRAAGLASLDMAAERTFRVSGWGLTLRCEVFNALNRTNFGTPVRVLDAPGFGTAVTTASPNRTIQLVLRVAR